MNPFYFRTAFVGKCLLLLTSATLFAFGLAIGALRSNPWVVVAAGLGWIVSTLWLSSSLNTELVGALGERTKDAQIILKDHRGLTRNIGGPMPLDDAMRVAYALSDGCSYAQPAPAMFHALAYSCPGGTLFLLRVGNAIH